MTYEVRRDGRRVLSFAAQPGVLLSQGARPPGFKPPAHPFLDAQAHDARFEDQLAGLLAAATSPSEFIAALKREGFEVIGG